MLAAERRTSMAQLIRDAAEQFVAGERLRPSAGAYVAAGDRTRSLQIADGAAAPTAVAQYAVEQSPSSERATLVPVPDHLIRWARTLSQNNGMSVEQFVRNAVEEKGVRMRPKPLIGIYNSGFTDTAERSTEGTFEPPPWRSS